MPDLMDRPDNQGVPAENTSPHVHTRTEVTWIVEFTLSHREVAL